MKVLDFEFTEMKSNIISHKFYECKIYGKTITLTQSKFNNWSARFFYDIPYQTVYVESPQLALIVLLERIEKEIIYSQKDIQKELERIEIQKKKITNLSKIINSKKFKKVQEISNIKDILE